MLNMLEGVPLTSWPHCDSELHQPSVLLHSLLDAGAALHTLD